METEGKATAFDVQKIEKGKEQKRDGEKRTKTSYSATKDCLKPKHTDYPLQFFGLIDEKSEVGECDENAESYILPQNVPLSLIK